MDQKTKLDINKFQWKQVFNNSKGKSDAILLGGTLTVFVGLGGFASSGLCILIMVIFHLEKDMNVINFLSNLLLQSLGLVGVGFTALGVDRVKADKDIKPEDHVE
jgi:hypothetical protein